MNKFIKSLILGGFVTGFLVFAGPAFAYNPTLSANYQGGNNNVQITVSNASAYSQINLFYRQSSTLWTTVNNIGQTDGSGYFTQVISMPSDGSSSQVQLYVTVGGQQTSTISIYPGGGSGCGYYGCGVGGLTISPSSLNISVGQSASANVSIGSYIYSGSYYISSNSNSNVASASVSGNTINVYGFTSGNTTITVCSTSSSCAYLYVTVSGGSIGGNIYFSPSSLTLTAGQSQSVTIYSNNNYYNSNYYISSNSNSNVASASISGNSLYVNALASGSTSIAVCQSGYSNCATLYVTVSGSSGGSLSLSQTSVSLSVGQTVTVTAYNAPAVYISSNSNPSSVVPSLDMNKVNLYGSITGNATIYVCAISSSTQCANIYVTVSGGSIGGNIYFSPSSLSLTAGQSQSVTIYNNSSYYGSYYISSNSNSNVASAYVSGNSLYVNALVSGSTSIAVCQSGYSNCATLYVTVSGGSSNTNLWFSPTNPNLYVGQSLAVSVNSSAYTTSYPYSNAYYIASNSNSNVASASISGTVLNLYAYQNGSTNISVCHSSLSFCSTLYVTVGGGSSGGSLSLSQTSVNVGVNQNANVTVYGNGSYYISSNINSSIATASISGNTLSIYGRQYGNTTISICQSGYSSCVSVYVTVSGYSTGGGLQYPGGGVLGATVYSNGQLISENGTVFMVYKNTKTGFVSASVFTGLGFKFVNVMEVGASGLMDSGYLIRNSNSSHPWGTWVKSGSTVYFVHEQGLIPAPDWNTFLNNGGQASFIVSANSYDLALPRLSNMTYSDYRLR